MISCLCSTYNHLYKSICRNPDCFYKFDHNHHSSLYIHSHLCRKKIIFWKKKLRPHKFSLYFSHPLQKRRNFTALIMIIFKNLHPFKFSNFIFRPLEFSQKFPCRKKWPIPLIQTNLTYTWFLIVSQSKTTFTSATYCTSFDTANMITTSILYLTSILCVS